MAQTGYSKVQIYSSSTATNTPSAGNLTNDTNGSELAINITDGKLFYKDNSSAIQVIGWKTTPTTAGGTGLTSFTANGVVYASSTSALATGSALTFNGTTALTIAGAGSDANGGGPAFGVSSNSTADQYYMRLNASKQLTFYGYDQSNSASGWVSLATADGGKWQWYTAGSERARIDSSGNFTIGNTSGSGLATQGINLVGGIAASQIYVGHATGVASGTYYQVFTYNATTIGGVTQNGTTGVLYNLTSDYRLKNNQEDLTGAKDFIMALKPKKWQWWDGSGEGVGFVAHEFMEVAKYSGHGEKDAVDADGKPVYQSIQSSSSEVMANLVSFIQEQQALITTLTARITALESA